MDIQTIIVGLVILVAVAYLGRMLYRKVMATTGNAGCGTDCGCGTGGGKKMAPINIKRR